MKSSFVTAFLTFLLVCASRVHGQSYAFSTIAGQAGQTGYVDATGAAARFNRPVAVGVDAAGNVYVGESYTTAVRKITPAGAVSTLATLANGTAGLAVDAAGNVFVADATGNVIRKVTSAGVASVVAGLVDTVGSADGTGTAARFNACEGVAVDASGNVYVADTGNHTIRKITSAGVVSTIAGLAGVSGSIDGTGVAARFRGPTGVAVDAAGNLYVADNQNYTVRKITPAGVVTTLAGQPGYSGSSDGTGSNAHFYGIRSVAVDSAGNIFTADIYYNVIRKITSAGVVTTVGGQTNSYTYGSVDGVGGVARFNAPLGMAVDTVGNLFVADSGNNTIRRGALIVPPAITTQPTAQGVAVGQSATFTVAASGTAPLSYQWQRQATGGNGFVTILEGGAYSGTATATLTVSGVTALMHGDQFRCVVDNAAGSPATSTAVALSVNASPAFTSAGSATFYVNVAGAFSVTTSGSPAPVFSVTSGALPAWLSLNASTGVLSGTPTSTAGSPFSFTLSASNGVGAAATQAFTVTVAPAPVAPVITSASAARQIVAAGATLNLAVTASGTTPMTFQWKRNGLPIAGATAAGYTVNAVTVRDNGYYQVVVRNAGGSVTSTAMFVNVMLPTPQVVAWGSNSYSQTTLPSGLTGTLAIAAGGYHSLALKIDGTVVAWGYNGYSQTSVPVGLTNVVAIAAGSSFSLALKSDGTVIGWGDSLPATVPTGLSGVVAIAAGSAHALALKSDGTVVAWGSNYNNQAVVPTGLSGVVAIAGGGSHSLALLANGSLIGWGYSYSNATVAPADLGPAIAIGGGAYHSVAVKSDGTVAAWGDSYASATAVPAGLTGVVALSVRDEVNLVLKADGTVVGWGDAYGSVVGSIPPDMRAVAAVAAGSTHGLILRDASGDVAPSISSSPASVAANLGQSVKFSITASGGTAALAYQWYRNGTAITGATSASYVIPEMTSGSVGQYDVVVSNSLGSVTSADATLSLNTSPIVGATGGGRYALAPGQSLTLTLSSSISGTATVQWRRNGIPIAGATSRTLNLTNVTLAQAGYYQAYYNEGSGSVASAAIFVPVTPVATQVLAFPSNYNASIPTGLTDVVALAARSSNVLAVRASGAVVQWGSGGYNYYSPPTGLGNVVAVAASTNFFFALKGDGTVAAWGDSYYGMQWMPPAGLANVVAIAAGSTHGVAVKNDGTVVAWGPAGSPATAVPAGLANVVSVAAGNGFTLALRADGTVVGWGANYYGQSSVPLGLTGVTAIAAGNDFSLALKSDGSVVAWGYNGYGQTNMPAGLTNVVSIAAGDSHALALKSDGSIAYWGSYSYDYYSNYTLAPIAARNVFGLAGGGSYSLLVRDASADTAPVIGASPPDVAAFSGQTVTLTVNATAGTAPISYQWRKSGSPIAGATNASLVLRSVKAASAGSYDVIVSTYLGSTASVPATLSVSATPGVTTNPTGRRVVVGGQNLAMTAAAAIPGPVTYQWMRNGQLIAGATSATYTLTAAKGRDGGVYQAVATNSVGPAVSAPIFVAVNAGGQVRAWGSSSSGQTSVPSGLSNVTAVATGDAHSLALLADGTVTAWGANTAGQINVPTGLTNVVAIAGGAAFSMALSADGTVTTWGAINFTPVGASDVVAIAASNSSSSSYYYSSSYSYALALRSDGTVVAWTPSGLATDVPVGLTDVVAVSAGSSIRLALKADGTLVRWGDSSTVVPAGLSGVVGIACGVAHNLALKSDGTVVAWQGSSYYGEASVPAGLAGVVAIAAGQSTSLALKSDGSVVAWGDSSSPVVLGASGQAPVLSLSVGSTHALALRDASGDAAPVITALSGNQSVTAGQSVTLSVTATGTPPPSFQWYRNGVAISGATSSTYTVSSASSANAGAYTVTVYSSAGSTTSAEVNLVVSPTLNQRGLLTSVTRANPGPAVLYGTFTVEGTASKQMLVRAVGPALANFGVTGALANPQLTITSAAGVLVATSDDWGTSTNATTIASVSAQVGAYALAAGSKDAAVVRSYAPGTYHVRVSGVGGGAGVAMLEIYDADSSPRLVYLAACAFAGPGADAFVQGFTLSGAPAGRSYLIRAIGPSLASAGALADPRLAVFDAAGTQLVANDDWGGDSALAALASNLGAMPLPSNSKDAAVNFSPPAGGSYTVQVSGAGATNGVVLLEIFEADTQRASVVPAAIVAQPQDVLVLTGQPATLGVVSLGRPAPTYQWSKNGVAISGATGASLAFAGVQAADAGAYSVVVTSGTTTATSTAANVTIVSQAATHAVVGRGYVAGSTVTITNTLTYTGTATSLGWQVTLPTGWSFASDAGAAGDVKPAVGATSAIEWAWTTPPASPVTFSYTLNVPAGETGVKNLTATAIVRTGTSPVSSAATPGSLAVDVAPVVHSADTDQNNRISLLELTRVIELYNTRNGTVRTGAYKVDATGEDGFAADPTRASTATVTLTKYHTADSDQNGKLGLLELTRVIELYNARSGTTRTGQYHVQAGTEDGFAPGP